MQVLNSIAGLKPQRALVLGLVLVSALLAVGFSGTLAILVDMWWRYADYNYGFFVIPFSCLLLWDRREMLDGAELRGSLWSIPFLLLGAVMAGYAAHEYILTVGAVAIVPLLLGTVLLLGGWRALQWSWSAILFLVFMVPLPGAVAGALRLKLQLFATDVSVYTLQTLGLPTIAQGNVIYLANAKPLQVAEACSGIRMLMLFLAACIGAAFFLRREIMLTRVLIVLSAIPIAVIANVMRITATAFLYETVGAELGDKVFHDLAGWFMMPVAILILWAETSLFARLFSVPERDAPIAFGTSGSGGRIEAPSRPSTEKAT